MERVASTNVEWRARSCARRAEDEKPNENLIG